MSKQITFENRIPDAFASELLFVEFRKITSVDLDNQFRFIIRFTGNGSSINNFTCKVYPYCTDDEAECLGILHRGDRAKMVKIKKDFNEC